MTGNKQISKTIDQLDEFWLTATNAMRSREYETAIEFLQKILRIDKRNSSAHNRLGIVYAKLGNYGKSLKHFKKSNKYDRSASSEHNIGLLYYETKKYKKAKAHLEAALVMESLAVRHVALAKVCEKLEDYNASLNHLELAMKLEPSKQVQQIYVDATVKYGTNKRLSKEILEALQKNDVVWDFEIIDKYPLLVDVLQSLHLALQKLVFSRPNKKINLRSENARGLMIAYLHNLSACIFLLDKNYSLASANVARSMFEIHLKLAYGLRQKTNRGFAEIEKSALVGKFNANSRLIKKIPPTDPLYKQKIADNRRISSTLKSLNRRYVNLQTIPSHREIALMLDGNMPGKNYFWYEQLYEKGSDIIHAERSSISRSVMLSNTQQAGLFLDSYELLQVLIDLTRSVGSTYKKVPGLTGVAVNKYQTRQRSIRKSIRPISTTQGNVRSSFFNKKLRQPRRIKL